MAASTSLASAVRGLYARHPLPTSRHIRLLKIKRRPQTPIAVHAPAHEIECDITVVQIGKEPPYRALSYTWDEPYRDLSQLGQENTSTGSAIPVSHSHKILCEGEEIPVSSNLHNALNTLQELEDLEYIWNDALCIDQADKRERSQQVACMNDIFSRATEVLVWLGGKIQELEDIKWVIEVFITRLEELEQEYGQEEVFRRSMYDSSFFGLPDLVARIQGFGRFFAKCRYFSRAWILQEVVVASKLRVFCGDAELVWVELVHLTSFFRLTNWAEEVRETTDQGDAEMKETLRSFGSCYRWQAIRDVYWEVSLSKRLEKADSMIGKWFGPMSDVQRGYVWLFYILNNIRFTECSANYPHDKIFSALGVGKRLLSNDNDRLLHPNYLLEASRVYTNVATAIIEGTNSLFLLGHVGTPNLPGSLNLPSWVPDFTQNGVVDPINLREGRSYNASGHLQADTKNFKIAGDMLQLHGLELDRVQDICALTTQEWQNTNKIHIMISFAELIQPDWDVNGQSTDSRIETLWRSIIGDTYNESQPAPHNLEDNFYNYVAMFLEAYKHKATLARRKLELEFFLVYHKYGPYMLERGEVGPNKTPDTFWGLLKGTAAFLKSSMRDPQKTIQDLTTPDKLGPFLDQTMLLDRSRRLLRTENGHLVLGPTTALPGDCIYAVDDHQAPLVLRSTAASQPGLASASFRLVGECYMHGFMHRHGGPISHENNYQAINII